MTSEVWAVPVSEHGAGVVAVLFNRALIQERITVSFKTLDIHVQSVEVRDLLNKVDLGSVKDSFSAVVPAHGCVMVKFILPQQLE